MLLTMAWHDIVIYTVSFSSWWKTCCVPGIELKMAQSEFAEKEEELTRAFAKVESLLDELSNLHKRRASYSTNDDRQQQVDRLRLEMEVAYCIKCLCTLCLKNRTCMIFCCYCLLLVWSRTACMVTTATVALLQDSARWAIAQIWQWSLLWSSLIINVV